MKTTDKTPTPFVSYFVKACYEWLADNDAIQHISVLANYLDDPVLEKFANKTQGTEDTILRLNIAPRAIAGLDFTQDYLMFKARFAGKEHLVSIPYGLIIEIYDRDNPSTGIIFNTVEGIHIERRNMMKQPVPNKQKPSLRIVK